MPTSASSSSPQSYQNYIESPHVNKTWVTNKKHAPILTAGCAVQVDDQLKVVLGGPCNGFREIGQLAANIRLAGSNFEGPVADGQAYMVQTCGMSKKMQVRNTAWMTYPAAAMAAKSVSVIHVSQWALRVALAVALDCNLPKVH